MRAAPILRTAVILGLVAASTASPVAGARAAEAPKPPLPVREAQTPNAVIFDPHPDKAHPPGMADVRIASHGANMNAVLYTAAGGAPHPVVLLFHGFPGNEQNLDLAQAIRRAGFTVLTLHYRGSWGSPGKFSFTNALEDSDVALAWLRDPTTVSKFHLDPRRIFVAGHSMGGMMAASATAHDARVAGLVMISAWDIGGAGAARFSDAEFRKKQLESGFADNVVPLATTPDALMDEIVANASKWDFVDYTPDLKSRPALIITADDGLTPDNQRLAAALKSAGAGDVTEQHMATDHSYSDRRIALESVIVRWLERHQASVASMPAVPQAASKTP
ncbi:MAG TPA: alpha/beta hydrolase [Rhizomicrobium sp.]